MIEPTKLYVEAVGEISRLFGSIADHDEGMVSCTKGDCNCQRDAGTWINCPDCGILVCGWHMWYANGVQYCPVCVKRHK